MQNEKPKAKLKLGNCLDILKTMPDNYVDSIVTDPPYGLSFMGKKWDYDVPSKEIWAECLRVLKPGGHLLAFGGTRTYHRLVVAIEDAGFEIRDQIQWIYGQGFPKSQDISKAIDKAAGAEGPIVGKNPAYRERQLEHDAQWETAMRPEFKRGPATPEAKQWSGWGTALKPANEPICLARKPLSESTIAKNILKHGTGGLNIDGSRIGTADKLTSGRHLSGRTDPNQSFKYENRSKYEQNSAGRFPANVIFDEEAAKVLDGQVGSDVSRFFYIPKVSSKERGDSTHPTMKPVKLMEYLIKLITPPNGIVLDPFMGSGTTGVAAANLSVRFVGCEMSDEYFEIAKKRIDNA